MAGHRRRAWIGRIGKAEVWRTFKLVNNSVARLIIRPADIGVGVAIGNMMLNQR